MNTWPKLKSVSTNWQKSDLPLKGTSFTNDLGSHILGKLQKQLGKQANLKWLSSNYHKLNTTQLNWAEKKTVWGVQFRCPILKFLKSAHDVRGLHLRSLFYPSWCSCAVSNLTRIWLVKFHNDSTRSTILRKTLEKHSQSNHSNPCWIWCSNPQNELFFSMCFPMYWSCWSTSICKSLELFTDRFWIIDLCTEFWWRYMYWKSQASTSDSKTKTNF